MVRISASPHPTFNYVQVDDSLGDIGASPSPIHIQAIAVGVMYLGSSLALFKFLAAVATLSIASVEPGTISSPSSESPKPTFPINL